jgi:hypothetical protein
VIKRSREADAFLATVGHAAPEAVSACDGWTTHEIAAHVTGIAVEVTRHLEPYLQGDPVPRTRSFEEREAPLQAIGHLALLSRLDAEEERMRRMVGEVLSREPDAIIPWTGRRMGVAKFIPHLRNEHALHRWDIAGDDEISRQLLGSMDLVGHSVGELGRILLAAGRRHDPDPDSGFHVRLRPTCGLSSRTATLRSRGPVMRPTRPRSISTLARVSCSSGDDAQTTAAGSAATSPSLTSPASRFCYPVTEPVPSAGQRRRSCGRACLPKSGHARVRLGAGSLPCKIAG